MQLQFIDGALPPCWKLHRSTGHRVTPLHAYFDHRNSCAKPSGPFGHEQMGCPASTRIWWQFRVKVDAYLDIAEAEVKSFQKSLEELARYNECKSVFASLMSTYTRSNWTQSSSKLSADSFCLFS